MKLALIGYGKMGRMVQLEALRRGHAVVAVIDGAASPFDEEKVADADVCIDFTHPNSVVGNIRRLSAMGKSMVIGTTGWDEHRLDVKEIVSQNGVGAIYGSNFSLGVHLFFSIVRRAAEAIHCFEAYDVGIEEEHHRHKADSPSGTALSLQKILLDSFFDNPSISSLRCGSIPGTHRVIFDSTVDTITVSHQARSREGFAVGAVAAAEWIVGKKGLYTIEDMLRAYMSG